MRKLPAFFGEQKIEAQKIIVWKWLIDSNIIFVLLQGAVRLTNTEREEENSWNWKSSEKILSKRYWEDFVEYAR